jgi:hypothetical protein
MTIQKENLPNHSEATVARVFTEPPDGWCAKVVRPQGKEMTRSCLPTLLIVCDIDGELFPSLQTRIETRSTGPIQIHTRVREGTLCHGMSE